MYAMLTGFLPYMMEPFNVMEMYEKMMQRKMTPVPSFLSQGKYIRRWRSDISLYGIIYQQHQTLSFCCLFLFLYQGKYIKRWRSDISLYGVYHQHT